MWLVDYKKLKYERQKLSIADVCGKDVTLTIMIKL